MKKTDGRWQKYFDETGSEHSWELDALDPAVLSDLVDEEIRALRDETLWREAQVRLEGERQALKDVATWWESVEPFVQGKKIRK